MRCTKLVKCICIIFFLSFMHFDIDALKEEGPEPLNRRNIFDDLRSLLGLTSDNTSQSQENPTIDTNRATITTSNTSSTNNTIINDDNFITNDKNKTYTDTNITSITNNVISTNNSEIDISKNDSLSSNFTQIAPDESGNFTGFTNDTLMNLTTNSTGGANNINMTTNWSLSALNQSSFNLLNKATNDTIPQQYLATSNDTLTQQNLATSNGTLTQQNMATSNDTLTQQNLATSNDTLTQQNLATSNDTLTQQNLATSNDTLTQQNLATSNDTLTQQNLATSNDTLTQQNLATSNDTLTQQNPTTSNETSTDSNSTAIKTEQDFLPQPQPTDNTSTTSRCSTLPNFTETCQLPSEYLNQSDSLTTFSDIEKKLSNVYVQSCLLRYCSPGEWCLGSAMDGLINESLNISYKFCSSTFLTCLSATAAGYLPCESYKQFKTISDSLELICKYKELMNYQQTLRSCGFHTMKLISVTLSDLKRNIQTTQDFCYSQLGYLMSSFNCLLTQCQEVFTIILTGFDPWKWFTENRTKAFLCQNYYECASTSTLLLRGSSTTYKPYRLGGMTTRTSPNIEMTTESNFVDNEAIVGGLSSDEEVKTNEKAPDSRAFGDSVAENSHIMASLSAMMVILMIGMAIMMVVCWRHMRKNSSRKRAGYSKLKTGEC